MGVHHVEVRGQKGPGGSGPQHTLDLSLGEGLHNFARLIVNRDLQGAVDDIHRDLLRNGGRHAEGIGALDLDEIGAVGDFHPVGTCGIPAADRNTLVKELGRLGIRCDHAVLDGEIGNSGPHVESSQGLYQFPRLVVNGQLDQIGPLHRHRVGGANRSVPIIQAGVIDQGGAGDIGRSHGGLDLVGHRHRGPRGHGNIAPGKGVGGRVIGTITGSRSLDVAHQGCGRKIIGQNRVVDGGGAGVGIDQ